MTLTARVAAAGSPAAKRKKPRISCLRGHQCGTARLRTCLDAGIPATPLTDPNPARQQASGLASQPAPG